MKGSHLETQIGELRSSLLGKETEAKQTKVYLQDTSYNASGMCMLLLKSW